MRELGLDVYIVKPVRRADLMAAVATAMAPRVITLVPDPAALAPSTPPPAPIPDVAAFAPSTPPPAEQTASTALVPLLLVDDSADNRLLISHFLKRMPYQIEEAQNGAQGVQKALASRFGLILMDLQMPVMDGISATRSIRAAEAETGRARTPIVALTANVMAHQIETYRAAGVDDVVGKPLEISRLIEVIGRCADPQTRSAAA